MWLFYGHSTLVYNNIRQDVFGVVGLLMAA